MYGTAALQTVVVYCPRGSCDYNNGAGYETTCQCDVYCNRLPQRQICYRLVTLLLLCCYFYIFYIYIVVTRLESLHVCALGWFVPLNHAALSNSCSMIVLQRLSTEPFPRHNPFLKTLTAFRCADGQQRRGAPGLLWEKCSPHSLHTVDAAHASLPNGM